MWSPIEWAAVVTGLLSVWLTVRENVWCWPTGLVSVALYVWVFYQSKLYSETGLQVVFFLVSIYGWHQWLHGGAKHGELEVGRASKKLLLALGLLALVGAGVLGYAFDRWTDASMPYADALLTSLSLVAQWLLARKLWENWSFWIAVDIGSIGVFAAKQLIPTAGLYGVFLLMAIAGWREWRLKLRQVPA